MVGGVTAIYPAIANSEYRQVRAWMQVLYKNGMIAFSCGRDPYRLRFLVPAVMQKQDVELAGKILEKSILEMLQ